MNLPPPGRRDRLADVESRPAGGRDARPSPAAHGPAPLGDLLTQLPQADPEDDTCILAVRLPTGDVIGGA